MYVEEVIICGNVMHSQKSSLLRHRHVSQVHVLRMCAEQHIFHHASHMNAILIVFFLQGVVTLTDLFKFLASAIQDLLN